MARSRKQITQQFVSWYFSREALPFWAISVVDAVCVFASMVMMYSLVYGPAKLVGDGSLVLSTLLINMLFYGIGMRVFHTYTDVSKILEFKDLSRTAFSVLLGTLLCLGLRWAVDMLPFTTSIPYRVFILTWVSATALLWVWRIVARNFADKVRERVHEEVELLPRQKIEVNMERIGELLHGKKVLVTGAAGSIGSEMVRQIASYVPSKLILVDQAETPLHDLMQEMRQKHEYIDAQYLVTTITDRDRMEAVFSQHRPDYVFHAAAYKHVPMMEIFPSVSILNNVVGTMVLADMAVKYGVKKFVMISTDKAVNPTNVMGCSKRLCEIYVQSLNAHLNEQGDGKGKTQFVTTRFGNVLGSNGSVIPLFKRQIEAGGPVTVTHPAVVRFFMLIPEACALVLEAGTMGHGGEVFVFDMGQPVKIADLARRLILNSGRRDVTIMYTGLREGEKLYEEVLIKGENEVPTDHPKIRVAKVQRYEYEEVCREFEDLVEVAKTCDELNTVRKMKEIVPEFKSRNSKFEALDVMLAKKRGEDLQ